ncbi:DUF6061 family protein [Paenibacillus hemerocallicola]|uniref:DUF6061 family protein n=1 Tax=Paenibacillus hemerocallicola TaxID=1172614 RepID=UPI003CCC5F7A
MNCLFQKNKSKSSEIEATLETHAAERFRLIWLKEKEPFAYAELVLINDLKRYAGE